MRNREVPGEYCNRHEAAASDCSVRIHHFNSIARTTASLRPQHILPRTFATRIRLSIINKADLHSCNLASTVSHLSEVNLLPKESSRRARRGFHIKPKSCGDRTEACQTFPLVPYINKSFKKDSHCAARTIGEGDRRDYQLATQVARWPPRGNAHRPPLLD